MLIEAVLTMGLVSVILGTASGAQQVGLFGALGVGGYVALAGLWASPLSGASMNPARTFGPDLVSMDFAHYWVYVVGPLVGTVVAVGIAWMLRGPGVVGPDRWPHRARSPRRSSIPTRTDGPDTESDGPDTESDGPDTESDGPDTSLSTQKRGPTGHRWPGGRSR